MLSELMAPFDYPRQAAYQAVKGLGNLVSGQGGSADALRMAPLLGLGAGMMAGGPLLGIAGMGAAHALNRLAAPDEFETPSASQLAEQLGVGQDSAWHPLATIGTQLLTDPLTYAGLAKVANTKPLLPWLTPSEARFSQIPPETYPRTPWPTKQMPAQATLAEVEAAQASRLEKAHAAIEAEAAAQAAGEDARLADAVGEIGQDRFIRRMQEARQTPTILTDNSWRTRVGELGYDSRLPETALYPFEMPPAEIAREVQGRYGILRDMAEDTARGRAPTVSTAMERASALNELLHGERALVSRATQYDWLPRHQANRAWEQFRNAIDPATGLSYPIDSPQSRLAMFLHSDTPEARAWLDASPLGRTLTAEDADLLRQSLAQNSLTSRAIAASPDGRWVEGGDLSLLREATSRNSDLAETLRRATPVDNLLLHRGLDFSHTPYIGWGNGNLPSRRDVEGVLDLFRATGVPFDPFKALTASSSGVRSNAFSALMVPSEARRLLTSRDLGALSGTKADAFLGAIPADQMPSGDAINQFIRLLYGLA